MRTVVGFFGGLLLLLIAFPSSSRGAESKENKNGYSDAITTKVPEPFKVTRIDTSKSNRTIFCKIDEKKYLSSFFKSAKLRITSEHPNDVFQGMLGPSPTEVTEKAQNGRRWTIYQCDKCSGHQDVTWTFSFSAFEDSCLLMEIKNDYRATLIVQYVDPLKVTFFLLGLFFIGTSPFVGERNVFLVQVAVLGAIFPGYFIVVPPVIALLPQQGNFLSFIIGCLAGNLAVDFTVKFWENIELFAELEMTWLVLMLIAVGACIGLKIADLVGPPPPIRTITNFCENSLQALGLILIFFSSEDRKMSLVIDGIVYFGFNFIRDIL